MILTQKHELFFFQYPNFLKRHTVVHGVFTRKGGYSNAPYDGLNVGFDIGDDENNVEKNRSLISCCMGIRKMVYLKQVHSSRVVVIDKTNLLSEQILEADAVISNLYDIGLVIQTADCQSIILYDPEKKVIANIHAGWRGSIQNIVGNTIDVMQKKFGTTPYSLIAGIGPSLGPCCAEFKNYKNEIPNSLWQYKNDEKDYFDFWEITLDQLCVSGVLKENIQVANICTKCHTDLFFSYRANKVTGRFATVIGLTINCNEKKQKALIKFR